ncbi:SET domain-containing protein [Trinickia sp.]|uniref:SET domain-containing protein n=1 Tax=Trinickia sp. TaxID=2571163 RepID=UPI003F807913
MAALSRRFSVAPWGKEQQLIASESIKEGEVIVCETPLVYALDLQPQYGTPVWDLVDKILSKADLTQRYCTLRLKTTKFRMDREDEQNERNLANKHRRTRDFVKKLYFSVATNNIGYVDVDRQVIGHGIYPFVSRANHSCRPNATYQPGDIEKRQVALVALHDIRVGDAVTWSYPQSASFDDADYAARNLALMDVYRFVCSCARCQAEIPAELAMLPNLPRYFDDRIENVTRRRAEEIVKRLRGKR